MVVVEDSRGPSVIICDVDAAANKESKSWTMMLGGGWGEVRGILFEFEKGKVKITHER